jgi:hypothetical protein
MARASALVLAALILLPVAASAEGGSTGLSFLKLGVGGRAIGMGDAYAAVDGDASCLYWNPAGCASIEGTDVLLMHSEWFEGVTYEFVGAARSFGDQAFGLGVFGLYMDDLERREGPTSEPIGHFGVFDFAVTGSYARGLTDCLRAGGSVKYLHEKIDDELATGVAVDLGAQYDVPAVDGLSAGVAVQNLGPQMSFIEEKFDLPVTYRVGAAYDAPLSAVNGALLLVGDAVLANDGDPKVHLGFEFEYAETIALRLGYRTGWDNQNVSVGLGAKVGDFSLDYAYVPFYSDLGDTHRISLGLSL